MISVIYGAKGTGKTRRIVDAANLAAEKAAGRVVFLSDSGDSLSVKPNVRFVDLGEYGVDSEEQFIGFIKGLLAGDFDIHDVFIDGLSRLLKLPTEQFKPIFDMMSKVADNVNFVVTISSEKLPEFLKPFAVV